MESNEQILSDFKKNRNASAEICKEQHRESYIDELFYAGKPKAIEELFGDEVEVTLDINHIQPVINKVNGFLRQTRRPSKLEPREEINEIREYLSTNANAALDIMRDNADADIYESDQDKKMIIGGMGVGAWNLSFLKDENGQAIFTVIDPKHYIWDTAARSKNVADRNWDAYCWVMPRDAARKIFNVEDDMLDNAPSDLGDMLYKSRNRSVKAYTDSPKLKKEGYADDVGIMVYQWRSLEKFIKYTNPLKQMASVMPEMAMAFSRELEMLKEEIINLMNESGDYEDAFKVQFDINGKYLTVKADYAELIDQSFELFGIVPDYDDIWKWSYKTAFLSPESENVLKKHYNISQTTFSTFVKTGTFDDDTKTWVGLVRAMREPAMYFNKVMSEEFFILANRAKGGVVAEESAIPNIEEFEQDYARSNSVAIIADGATGKVMPKNDAGGATGYEGKLEQLSALVIGVTGLNPEYLGSSDAKQVSNALEQTRIKQVSYVLADYVDSCTLYARESARWGLDAIRYLVRVNGSFAFAVTGDDGLKLEELTQAMVDVDYDINISDAPISPVAKETKANFLLNIAGQMATLGNMAFYEDVIRSADIFGLSRSEINRMVAKLQPPQPDPQAQQMQMQAAQMQMAKEQADIENKQADTQKKTAETQKVVVETTKAAQQPVESVQVNL